MKNKWELLYNPFTKIAGWKAFAAGTVIVCITVLMGYYNNAYLSGLQIKLMGKLPLGLGLCFLTQATGLLGMIILMYLVSLCFVKRVRLLDVAGTVLLARFPYLLMALLLFSVAPILQSVVESLKASFPKEAIAETMTASGYALVLLFGTLTLLLLAWHIALLYHAFKVSTGIKGRKTAVLFTGVLLLSEVIAFALLRPCFVLSNNL
jgi:hypothetical protein